MYTIKSQANVIIKLEHAFSINLYCSHKYNAALKRIYRMANLFYIILRNIQIEENLLFKNKFYAMMKNQEKIDLIFRGL